MTVISILLSFLIRGAIGLGLVSRMQTTAPAPPYQFHLFRSVVYKRMYNNTGIRLKSSVQLTRYYLTSVTLHLRRINTFCPVCQRLPSHFIQLINLQVNGNLFRFLNPIELLCTFSLKHQCYQFQILSLCI